MIGERIHSKLQALESRFQYRRLSLSEGLSFVDNDYLGISTHPRLVEAGSRALRLHGAGSTGSRLLGGHSRLFEATEAEVAGFFGAPAALLFSTGYMANLAVLGALSEVADHVLSDEKNHASLIDGIRLSGLPKTVVPHGQWDLATAKSPALWVSESLFSMDGDIAPCRSLIEKASANGGMAIVDEAHACGVFGERGEGVVGAGVDWDHVVKVVTFGKAFGVAGAAVCGSKRVMEWLVNRARPFIFTTAPSPAVVAMIGESLKIVQEESWRREELLERARVVRDRLSGLAQNPLPRATSALEKRSPIIPFRVPGASRVLRFSQNVRESGMNIKAIRSPTVAHEGERLRISLSLRISRDNTEMMAETLVKLWTEFLLQEQTQA